MLRGCIFEANCMLIVVLDELLGFCAWKNYALEATAVLVHDADTSRPWRQGDAPGREEEQNTKRYESETDDQEVESGQRAASAREGPANP